MQNFSHLLYPIFAYFGHAVGECKTFVELLFLHFVTFEYIIIHLNVRLHAAGECKQRMHKLDSIQGKLFFVFSFAGYWSELTGEWEN